MGAHNVTTRRTRSHGKTPRQFTFPTLLMMTNRPHGANVETAIASRSIATMVLRVIVKLRCFANLESFGSAGNLTAKASSPILACLVPSGSIQVDQLSCSLEAMEPTGC